MSRFFFLTALALVSTYGCASMDTPSPALSRAQDAVQTAEQDSDVLQSAAVELDRARQSLAAAQASFDEDGNNDLTEHQAYLAERYADVAMAQAQVARLNDEIEDADAERNEVLLEARRAEAARAEALATTRALQARQAEQQASTAEQQAATAEQRAQQLQSRLDDLQAQQTERGIVLTLGDVLFETDGAEVQPGAERTLAELVAFLEEYDGREVLIEGHTDSRGSDTYNQMLSEQRANAVRDELLDEGVAFDRIHTRGLGESAPVASNDTAAGRQQNRRVEVIISDEDGEFATPATTARRQ